MNDRGVNLRTLRVGDVIPPITAPPISRFTLAMFAGASGDHNPVHVDLDAAKAAGLDDVIAHGMLSMAYLGRLLTSFAPQDALRSFGARFVAITHVHDRLICRGEVVELLEEKGEKRARLSLTVSNQDGETILVGEAVIALT